MNLVSVEILPALAGQALSAVLGFALGLLAFAMNESRKACVERRALSRIFLDHIGDRWRDVDRLQTVPVNDYLARAKADPALPPGTFFYGEPEFAFEVDDLDLYRTHGARLLGLLGPKPRSALLRAYRLLRQAEQSRLFVAAMKPDAPDQEQHRQRFLSLVKDYSNEMLRLHDLLERDLTFWPAATNRAR
ncbi:MAG TPA: hypothetical protein VGE57_08965 [Solimonas sp.]